MEVDERPTEQYSDIGGLDKQIQEVIALCDCKISTIADTIHVERKTRLKLQP